MLKNDLAMLASVTDTDLIAKEFSKHEKCSLSTHGLPGRKVQIHRQSLKKVIFKVILMLSVK